MTAKHLRPLALGASILILAAAGGTAFAQNAPPPPGAQRDHHDWRGQHGDPAARAQRHAEHLRAALQLTPAQEPALNAYIAAAKPPEGMREHHRGDRQQMAALTTPERLDRMKARMDEHRAMFERRAAATKRFYAQLSPSQQKAFDTLHAGHGGREGRGHGRHGPMGQG